MSRIKDLSPGRALAAACAAASLVLAAVSIPAAAFAADDPSDSTTTTQDATTQPDPTDESTPTDGAWGSGGSDSPTGTPNPGDGTTDPNIVVTQECSTKTGEVAITGHVTGMGTAGFQVAVFDGTTTAGDPINGAFGETDANGAIDVSLNQLLPSNPKGKTFTVGLSTGSSNDILDSDTFTVQSCNTTNPSTNPSHGGSSSTTTPTSSINESVAPATGGAGDLVSAKDATLAGGLVSASALTMAALVLFMIYRRRQVAQISAREDDR